MEQEDAMRKFVRYFARGWFALGLICLIFYFSPLRSAISLGRISLAMAVSVLIVSVISVTYEKRRRKSEGYYVSSWGGAEGGFIIYNEQSKTLRLCFVRGKDIIYVPSDTKWQEIMPEWAKHRKDEILGRIQRLFGRRWLGKDWKYEESDRRETLIRQN